MSLCTAVNENEVENAEAFFGKASYSIVYYLYLMCIINRETAGLDFRL